MFRSKALHARLWKDIHRQELYTLTVFGIAKSGNTAADVNVTQVLRVLRNDSFEYYQAIREVDTLRLPER